MLFLRLFCDCGRSLVPSLLCILERRFGKASLQELWWFLWLGSVPPWDSSPAPSQVLLPGQQQVLRPVFSWRTAPHHCAVGMQYPMVTWMVTEAEPGKHRWVLLQQEQPAPSALLVFGLLPSLAWKQKGADLKSRKKCAFIPSRCLCESSHAKPSLGELQQGRGLGQCSVREWHQLCLDLYVPALEPPWASAAHPPCAFQPWQYSPFHSHREQVLAEAGPVCLAQHKPLWDQVRHCLGLHSSRLSSRENE